MATSQDPSVILIVDSDALMLTATAAVLNMSGHECHCAQDAAAALKAIRTLPIDLVICEVQLKQADGLELCREIRAEPNGRDVPLLFVSNNQIPDIVRRVHEAGGAYYLRKPYDPDVLIELVGKALWMPHLVNSRMRQEARKEDRQDLPQSRRNGGRSEATPGANFARPLPAALSMPALLPLPASLGGATIPSAPSVAAGPIAEPANAAFSAPPPAAAALSVAATQATSRQDAGASGMPSTALPLSALSALSRLPMPAVASPESPRS